MAHNHVSAPKVLAGIFLAHIPGPERTLAIRDLAATLDSGRDYATAELVAELLEQNPDVQAAQSLYSFLATAVCDGESQAVAKLCMHYSKPNDWLMSKAVAELQEVSELLSRTASDGGFVVAGSELSPFFEAFPTPAEVHSNSQDYTRIAVGYLSFAKHSLSLSKSPSADPCADSILNCSLLLVLAQDLAIANAAKDALYAYLGHQSRLSVHDEASDIGKSLWLCITLLLEHGRSSLHLSIAYQTWLRWLDLQHSWPSLQTIMNFDMYWSHLKETLATGDVEQRKLCLQILRRSVALAQHHSTCIKTTNMHLMASEPSKGRESTQSQYDRFCTVFETIVLGRYLNQTQDRINELDALASDDTMVAKTWLFALLTPAMSASVQDSIRKLIGNWFMSIDLQSEHHYEELARLLQYSFLPWATQGSLFTSTLRGNTKHMTCEHGNRLSAFLKRLLRRHSKAEQTAARRCIVRSVIDYLRLSRSKTMPHAAVYILHGINAGLEGEENSCLQNQDLQNILDISTTTGFQEIARDVYQIQCFRLCESARQGIDAQSTGDSSESGQSVAALKLATLSSQVDHLGRPTHKPASVLQWQTLSSLVKDLDETRCACLQAGGVLAACRSLSYLLDLSEAQTITPQALHKVLEAVWYEVEIQDYPKAALQLVPAIAFHPTCITHSMVNDTLAAFLSSVLSDFKTLVKGRIYVWAPLMRALRMAVLNTPTMVQILPLQNLLVGFANHPPAARIEFQIESATLQLLESERPKYSHLTYKHYYGDHGSAGYAAYFDIVNRLDSIDSSLCDGVIQDLLGPWLGQKPPVPIVNKWKTSEQLQVILLLSEQRAARSTISEAEEHASAFLRLLAIEPLPRFRFLLEWIIIRIIIKHDHVAEKILGALTTEDQHSNPKYLASLIKIAVMTACLPRSTEEFVMRVACGLVALAASSKIIIRHEAQWSFPFLWNHIIVSGYKTVANNLAFRSLFDYIKTRYDAHEPLHARELERFDPINDHTLVNLFQGDYLRLEPQGIEMVGWSDFDILQQADSSDQRLPASVPLACVSLGAQPVLPTTTRPIQSDESSVKASARTEALTAIQTKGTAYLAPTDAESNVDSPRSSSLMVIGSLVDNAINLGGLSRISEVFGASALYVANAPSVLKNKDFVAVSVSSYNHLPINTLTVPDIPSFLTQCKNDGYTIVGVEQTDRSVILGADATKLPVKTVLLMGAEKEGIPALLLGECDLLVEVPQKGVTRSLNVQTAAGVVLFEYARQHSGR